MPMKKVLIIFLLFVSHDVLAFKPDFYISYQQCKTVVAPLDLRDNPINISDSEPPNQACERNGENVECVLKWSDGGPGIKGNLISYRVKMDSPPLLLLELKNGTEHILVNTVKGAAVLNMLWLDKDFAGSKVCHGTYLTSFQLEQLQKHEK